MPSDGPYVKGDRVFVWHKDESKKKSEGTPDSSLSSLWDWARAGWFRALLTSQAHRPSAALAESARRG